VAGKHDQLRIAVALDAGGDAQRCAVPWRDHCVARSLRGAITAWRDHCAAHTAPLQGVAHTLQVIRRHALVLKLRSGHVFNAMAPARTSERSTVSANVSATSSACSANGELSSGTRMGHSGRATSDRCCRPSNLPF